MKALLKTEGDLDVQHHANAQQATHFDKLLRYGSISVEGIAATRSINPHAENLHPHSSTAFAGLSMPSAAGPASTKVGKRKSRASRKVPIKVFSADTSNFMAMVHRLTGFQASSYLLPGSPQSSLLKPLVTRPYPFSQGLYMPDSPAGDKMTAKFSNNSFSCASPQRNLSLSGKHQLDSINDVSLCTKEGFDTLHSPLSTNRFSPYIHNPAFKPHSQVLRNSNSWGSSSGTFFLPSQEDSMKEDCTKEDICVDSFNEHTVLLEDVSAASH